MRSLGKQSNIGGAIERMSLRGLRRLSVIVVCFAAAVLLVLMRGKLLTELGHVISVSDVPTSVDLAVLTPESGDGGLIATGDLVRARLVARVLVLVPEPTAAEAEFERRSIHIRDTPQEVLVKLGVPAAAISTIPAGEGGTTDSSQSLASWCRARPQQRILIVVGQTHATRYRRALTRVWNGPGPVPAICATPYDDFRPSTWWLHRRTLRSGLGELAKLFLDYATHPL
jgi:hypothetical protein